MMSIIDRDCLGDNKYNDKFEVHLGLTLNAAMDAIEKVELCNDFTVNRPIGRYRKGMVIFEKK